MHASMRSRALRLLVISSALVSLCLALTFAVAPHWHEQFHVDSDNQSHECAVALVSTGKFHHATTPDLVLAPVAVSAPAFLPLTSSVCIPSAFLDTSPYEHAPPIYS